MTYSTTQTLNKANAVDVERYASDLRDTGGVSIPLADLPISWESWQRLEELSTMLPYEEIVEGDAGDKHSVWVGRFMNDIEKPTILHPTGEEVRDILCAPPLMTFYQELLGEGPLCMRRCQINLLKEGGYVGIHVDQDANPDYLVAVILHFSDNYRGGEYVVHPEGQEPQRFKPTAPCVLFSRGDIPHEVAPVLHGERKTLVFFLSTNFGPTQKARSAVTARTQVADS